MDVIVVVGVVVVVVVVIDISVIITTFNRSRLWEGLGPTPSAS